jgi:putative hydrolase of the HAD superfamily
MSDSLPWQQIDTVFLDMDGTLLDLHFDNQFWLEHIPLRFSEKHQISVDAAKQSLYPRFQSLQGTIDWYCVDFWSNELDMDVASLKLELSHLIQIHPHAHEFLLQLRDHDKRVVLLTNAHHKVVNLKMDVTGLREHFDELISSHQFRLPKEHPNFWTELEKIDPFRKESTLFVDDSLPVLQAARQYGIAHLRGITLPDSQSGEKILEGFTGISSFEGLIDDLQNIHLRPE